MNTTELHLFNEIGMLKGESDRLRKEISQQQAEIIGLEETVRELQLQIKDKDFKISIAEDELNKWKNGAYEKRPANSIETGLDELRWKAVNLQTIQVMEALAEAFKVSSHADILEALSKMEVTNG